MRGSSRRGYPPPYPPRRPLRTARLQNKAKRIPSAPGGSHELRQELRDILQIAQANAVRPYMNMTKRRCHDSVDNHIVSIMIVFISYNITIFLMIAHIFMATINICAAFRPEKYFWQEGGFSTNILPKNGIVLTKTGFIIYF